MNWTSGLMMDHLQKDNLLPEAYAIVPTTFHTIFILAITVILSLWLIIRFYKKMDEVNDMGKIIKTEF